MDGILPLWKERGMTSHDCVFKLRKILGTKKIGHGGTLDPDVDGILPICLGKGTKLIQYLQTSGKTYQGEITLGYATTTEDKSGEKVSETPVREKISNQEIDEAMASMVGEITQIPPMYSAVRVNGKRLYEYAREGLEVERPTRHATISRFQRTSIPVYNEEKGLLSWKFEVDCGPGTYVRTLAVDTGQKLGYAAHMSDLTRTASGGFQAEQGLTLAQVSDLVAADDWEFLLPIETAVTSFERFDLNWEQYEHNRNGGFFDIEKHQFKDPDKVIALFYQDLLVSLYTRHQTKPQFLKPLRVLRSEKIPNENVKEVMNESH